MRLIAFLAAVMCWVFSGVVSAHAIQVTDSRGIQSLPAHPSHPVVLDWALAEQVIELGVTPVGAPELPGYADWVVQPAMPASTQSVGTRTEPNLEQIAALHPDVILVSEMNAGLLPQLQKIAPVLLYENFSAHNDHAQTAIKQFKQLAQVFDKQSVAHQKLAEMQQEFHQLKHTLSQAFDGEVPPVVVMRFASTTSTYLYSTNAMPHYVIKQLGLTDAFPVPPAKWGIVQKPIAALQHIDRGIVLYFLPFNKEAQLKKSFLWRAMPFVRQHRIHAVRSVWSYGGAMSLRYTAEAITESLLDIAHSHES